ncbi:transposon TX1 [Tanacetum coccineum]|uniref:Transposon TX1 n=1 Tax=Tanacetum coccineum TaxID=301880 RepID=A0ABQ4XND4_9ASTR
MPPHYPLPSEGHDIKPDPWDASECRVALSLSATRHVKTRMEAFAQGRICVAAGLSDDTLYFKDWSNNEKNLMCILKGFEMVSGLKINFNKSNVCGVGVLSSAVAEMARVMKYCMDELPLMYLGLLVGGSVVERYRVDHDCAFGVGVRIFLCADGRDGGRNGLGRKVEDVAGTSFWDDMWVGEHKLQDRDTWKWSLAENGIFSVRVLSTLVDEKNLDNGGDRKTTLLNKIVSKKIIVFVWRALCRRLSVRVELDKKGIDIPNILCPMCDETVETIDHALVLCNKSMRILLIQKLGRVLFSPNRQLFGDTIQLENVVSTISQEYLLEFTSEYGIPEDLHSELPGSEDMIMDFLEGKDGCHLANDWGRTRSGRSSVEYKPNGFVRPNPQPKPVQGKDWDSVSCVIVETATTTKVIQEPVLEKEVAAMGPPVNKRRRQRGTDEVEANAPPKVLRKDHATSHPV